MTENKRFTSDIHRNKRYEYWKDSDTAYDTKIKYGQYFRIIDKRDMVWLLNKQDNRIKELEERNKRQYNQLKELGDLMLKRDWKTLENMVEEWEKQEELLQAEWGTYCENK